MSFIVKYSQYVHSQILCEFLSLTIYETQAHLKEQSSIAGGLNRQSDQTWGEANEQTIDVGIFGVGTQQVGAEDIFSKQSWTAVTETPNTHSYKTDFCWS